MRHALPFLMLVCATSASADDGTPKTFEDGANCLFAGHSFYIPVAKRFDMVAKRSGFASHRVDLVFAAGRRGAPGPLWEDTRLRETIEKKLATGKVEVFGLPGGAPSTVEQYRRWIDLARKYNPKTTVFIGQFWSPGGPRAQIGRYDRLVEEGGEKVFEVVKELRKAYPDNRIDYVNYGKTASVMKARLDADDLADVDELVGRGSQALFRDRLVGHGGAMMVELSALSWLNVLYGAEIEDLKHTAYDESDLEEITTEVLDFNRKYR